MPQFHDFFINPGLEEEAEELGWSNGSISASVKILEANDWGELKQKINENRENYDILAFQGGNHELNRKAFSTPKMDVVLHPGKGRKDSGMNHVDAEKSAENDVAVCFSLREVPGDSKRQSQVLGDWRRNLKLCEKYNAPYILTTEAESSHQLRAPRDMAAVISSLGYDGRKAVSEVPGKILEKNLEARRKSSDYAGHEVVD
ncbi:RNase P subunit p30 family protein [Candidatus Nanohalobium constans]|uniref:Ribonuclease P protein component 3 n=1 Tax=Candidatus Nanohalobium constans TaxID=2565781 RepID=A0A5Q0UIS9_9ARCH|nr:RNase P subunit p30 family protein [Candidatus Nanohalobium constans]QGA80739.1 ribonuclease P/MRP protein subunit RPP1 [Candidatus Nanohalobium constans]